VNGSKAATLTYYQKSNIALHWINKAFWQFGNNHSPLEQEATACIWELFHRLLSSMSAFCL
jgi:heme A synthase